MNTLSNNRVFTVPNILSLYRLLSFPFLLWLCINENETAFALLLCINLFTDILDGLIARLANQETALGARLDSLADIGTYILAITGIFVFKQEILGDHIIAFSIFMGFYLATIVCSFSKFRKFTSFHLYSNKIGGYLQGVFFAMLFMNHSII